MASDKVQRLYHTLPIPQDQKCIRLLHVHRACNPTDLCETVRCSLTVEQLHKNRYSALSYVWGAVLDPPSNVECSGVDITVSTECLSALQRLRARLGSFTIWIDAICINQNDDDEKAQQIPMMKDIYMTAHTTYIWLGEGSPTKDKVMEYFSQAGLLEYYFNSKDEESGCGILPRPWAAAMHFTRRRLTPGGCLIPAQSRKAHRSSVLSWFLKPKLSFQDLEQILYCPWITRIWTYQEAALSRNPIVVCGSTQISWYRFAHCLVFLRTATQMEAKHLQPWLEVIATRAACQNKTGNEDISLRQLDDYRKFCRSVWCIRTCIARWILIPPTLTLICGLAIAVTFPLVMTIRSPAASSLVAFVPWLLGWMVLVLTAVRLSLPNRVRSSIPEFVGNKAYDRLLDTLSSRSSTNPKDMSFALHTILKMSTETDMDLPNVDYSLSKQQVYRQMTTYLLHGDRSLRVLLLAASNQCPDAPSWVPDYARALKRLGEVCDLDSKGNHPSGNFKPYFRLEDDSNTLVVKGFEVDTVNTLAHFHETIPLDHVPDYESHKENLKLLLEWFSYYIMRWKRSKTVLFASLYPFAKAGDVELPETRTDGNIPFYEKILLSTCSSVPRSKMEAYMTTLSSISSVALQTREDFGASAVWARLKRKNLLGTHVQVINALSQAKFTIFRTGNGYPGFAFGDIRKDDKIHIVSGFPVPLLLRKIDASLRIVSTCHVACSCVRMREIRPPSCFHSGNVWNSYMYPPLERPLATKSLRSDDSSIGQLDEVSNSPFMRRSTMRNIYDEDACYYVEQRRGRLDRVISMMQNPVREDARIRGGNSSLVCTGVLEDTLPDIRIS